MALEALPTNETRTLAQRLTEGRLPVPDALRCAMMLAERLRRLHEEGRAHGALSPRCVIFKDGVVDLVAGEAAITPYRAPETLDGRPADARSDVFSFGAILFEMLTGQVAFDGAGDALAAALATAAPKPSGSPAVDRLLANCLAKDPVSRWPRMQKVLMELKLLTVAARRAETPASQRRTEAADAALRAEMRLLETRVAARFDAHEKSMMALEVAAVARFEAHEKTMTELQGAAGELIQALKGQIAALETRVVSDQARADRLEHSVEALEDHVTTRFLPDLEAADERLAKADERIAQAEQGIDALRSAAVKSEEAATAAGERMARAEQGIETLRASAAKFEKDVAVDLHGLEAATGAQDAALQSARTAMAQTDDLVERVVEALESLQSAVLEQSEEHVAAVN